MNIFKNLSEYWGEEILQNGVWNAAISLPQEFISEFSNKYDDVDVFNGIDQKDFYVSAHITKVNDVPSTSIELAEFKSRQKEGVNAPGNLTVTNTVGLGFTDNNKGKITKIFNAWSKAMEYSLQGLWAPGNASLNATAMYGNLLVWMMDQTGTEILLYAYLDCVFPLKDMIMPSLDINSNDKVTLDVSFNCNLSSTKKWVKDLCQTKQDEYRGELINKIRSLFEI